MSDFIMHLIFVYTFTRFLFYFYCKTFYFYFKKTKKSMFVFGLITALALKM